MDTLEPMDVFGRLTVPFDVAAYCRGHKFKQVCVDLAAALRDEDSAKLSLSLAEKRVEKAQQKVKDAIEKAREAMQASKTV